MEEAGRSAAFASACTAVSANGVKCGVDRIAAWCACLEVEARTYLSAVSFLLHWYAHPDSKAFLCAIGPEITTPLESTPAGVCVAAISMAYKCSEGGDGLIGQTKGRELVTLLTELHAHVEASRGRSASITDTRSSTGVRSLPSGKSKGPGWLKKLVGKRGSKSEAVDGDSDERTTTAVEDSLAMSLPAEEVYCATLLQWEMSVMHACNFDVEAVSGDAHNLLNCLVILAHENQVPDMVVRMSWDLLLRFPCAALQELRENERATCAVTAGAWILLIATACKMDVDLCGSHPEAAALASKLSSRLAGEPGLSADDR